MTDRQSFIDKMLESPNDDTVRLVYADWLDEFGDCDRDRATAEFIRLSCKMVASPRLSLPEGKWLGDGPQGRYTVPGCESLIPSLFAYIRKRNNSFTDTLQYQRYGTVPLKWRREGRWLEIKYKNSPSLPFVANIIRIEFWRGFVRKVVSADYETSDEFIKLILPDQPLCEPTLRFIDNDVPNRWSCSIHSGSIGPKGHSIISRLPVKTQPDRVTRGEGYDFFTWEGDVNKPHRWSPQKRRYYAVACLLRHTAMMETTPLPVPSEQSESASPEAPVPSPEPAVRP